MNKVTTEASDPTLAKNVSASGILFDYKDPFPINSTVEIEFLKPNSFDFFRSKARIVRVEINPDNKTYDIGVEFIEMPIEEKNKLDYFISQISI